MDCQQAHNRIDDYLDGQVEPRMATDMAEHFKECSECADRLKEQEVLRQALRDLPVPPPSPDLWQRSMDRAVKRSKKRQRLWNAGGLAIAASLLLAVAVGLVTSGPGSAPTGPAVVAVSPGQTEHVNLVFNSRSRLEDVSLSLELPEGVEVAGHAGKRQLAWRTTLEPGRNLLKLPVVVNGPGGTLRANLRYGDNRRSFDLQIRPQHPDRSGLLPGPAV